MVGGLLRGAARIPPPRANAPAAALTTRPLPPWHVIAWDAWTRRHQARSRWFHKRTRLARDAEIAMLS